MYSEDYSDNSPKYSRAEYDQIFLKNDFEIRLCAQNLIERLHFFQSGSVPLIVNKFETIAELINGLHLLCSAELRVEGAPCEKCVLLSRVW